MIKPHGHHIIECHNGKRVKTDKIIPLPIKEHAEIHKEYYDKWGFHEDKVAWLGLSGQLVDPELFVETSRIGGLNNKGNKQSKEHKANRSKAMKGRVFKHSPRSKETRKKISEALIGNKHFDINKPGVKERHRQAMLKYWENKRLLS